MPTDWAEFRKGIETMPGWYCNTCGWGSYAETYQDAQRLYGLHNLTDEHKRILVQKGYAKPGTWQPEPAPEKRREKRAGLLDRLSRIVGAAVRLPSPAEGVQPSEPWPKPGRPAPERLDRDRLAHDYAKALLQPGVNQIFSWATPESTPEAFADFSYGLADAMLKRGKQ